MPPLPVPGLKTHRTSVERPEDGFSRRRARKNDINLLNPGGKVYRDLPKEEPKLSFLPKRIL